MVCKQLRLSHSIVPMLLLILMLGGCSMPNSPHGSSSNATILTATSTPSKPKTLSEYCKIVSATEVAHITGEAINLASAIPISAQEITCIYQIDGASSQTGESVDYALYPDATQA